MQRRRGSYAVLLGALVTLALSLSACGGASNDARPAPRASGQGRAAGANSSPSDPEFIASAEAICKRLNIELTISHSGRQSVSEMARLLPPRAKLEARTVAELSRLTPPATLVQAWEQIIAYRRTLAKELGRLGEDAKANNVAAIRALIVSKKHVHQELHAAATRAGFTSCARIG